jgi:WD40 repeat protein/Ca2+-binding EF-hand superfamily protein
MNRKEFAELLQVPGALADRIFAEFDMDEDGHLDLFEFIAMLAHVTLQDVPKRLKAVFNIFDPDDKGVMEMDLFKQMVEAILKIPSLDVPSDAKVKVKIQELKALYFLQENFVNLEQFSSMALSDKDIRNALTEIGIFSAKENITSSGDNDLEQELKKLNLNFVSEESMLKENVAEKKKDIDTEIFELLDFKIANAKPLREFEKQLPSLTPDDFLFLPSSIEAPSLLVDLKYVYGIRSYDTRNNLFVNPEGQLIYHAACFGIKLDPVANKQMFIMPTKQEIVAMDSWNNLTVVGEISENPTLTIWDNTKMEIQGVLYNTFQNGIAMVRFSDDGNLIAVSTLDDKRSIFIVHMAMMMVIAKSPGPEDPLLDMRFLPDGNSIALATPTQFCFIEKSSRKMVVRASTGWGVDDKRYATTLSIAINGTDPIVGTIDGRLLVFKGTHLFSSIQAHKGPVNSIVSRKGDKGVVSAATSKIIFWSDNLEKEHEVDIGNAPFVWNPKIRAVTFTPDEKHIYVSTRSGNVLHVDREGGVKMLMCSHSNGSLKGLASLNRSPDFVTCGQDSLVARWNSTENTIINCKQLPFPAEKICVSGDDKLLAVGCSNGLVLLINADTLNVMSSIKDRYREIQCIGFSPNNTMLAVGSADCSIFVYEIKKLGSPVILKGHKNGVANLDWSKDNQYLRSCTDNGEVLYWNLSDPNVALKTLESLKNMDWNTCNCPYTWETQAITPPQDAAIDVYSVDRSPDFNYIASTNSIGQIRIYRFPCTNMDANYTQAAGHGQHVTSVRFSCVQDRMFSLGGTDNCIIQWRLRPKPSETKFVNTEKFEMEEIENTKEPRESAGTKRSKRRRETKHQTLMRSSSIIQSEIVPMVNEVSMLTGVGEAGSTLKLQEDRDLIFLPATSAISAPVVKHDLPFEHIIAKSIPQNFKPNLKSKDPPDGNLYLKHVFGVRASDCKNTIKLLANDYEVVYPSGSLVIVTNMKTKKQRFFTGHLDDVIAIDLSSDRTMCVSAAVCDRNAPPERRETDYFIWDTTLMTEIGRVSGYHAGSARVVRFSPDSNVVLSVGRDDQHTLVVQNWKNDKMVCTAKIGTSPVYDADWSDKTHFVTVGKTHIKFWSIKLGNVNMVHGDWGQDEAEPLVCCKYIGRYCYTGSGDGNIAGWYDFKKGPNVKAHESPVYVLSFNSNKNLLISGGKDGMVKTWKANEFKIDAVATILDYSKYGSPEQEFIAIRSVDCVEFQVMEKQTGKGAGDDSYRYSQSEVTIVGTKSGDLIKYENGKFETVMQFHSREILSLTAHPTLSIFATSGADRTVRVWNAITGVGLPPLFVKDVVSSINWSPNGEYIVAGTDSGEVFLYTFNPFTRVAASKTIFAEKGCGILQIKFSPIILQNYFAVTGTEPCTQVQIMTQVGRELKNFGVIDTAFTGEIYRMDWSADSVYLRLNSSNGELGFANVGTLTIIEPENSTNIVWNEQSCPLALDSYGIFPVVPGLDVDCVARTSHKEVIATGDDFQQVKIFRFPANVEKCGCKTYLGHSSPITEITFMLNDNLLVTVGGKDKTIILWVTDFGNADSLRDDILEGLDIDYDP